MVKAVIFDMFETLITHYRSPLYFGAQMAADAGIPEAEFQKLWRATEEDRSLGNVCFEEVIRGILEEKECFREEVFRTIVEKRIASKEVCFEQLHSEILPMLDALKSKGFKFGLISNCFTEEAEVIRKSILFPYFDKVCLSCEEKVQKPDVEIYRRCVEGLGVDFEECLYIGDGGSRELETARNLGMQVCQAVWYFEDHTQPIDVRKEEFEQLENPMEVIEKALGRNTVSDN